MILVLAVFAAVGWTWTATPPKEARFGVLLCLTGEMSSFGEAGEAAFEVAVEDVNTFFSSIGSETSVSLVVEDTETDPEVALEKLKSLAGNGVRVVIGPQTSAEVKAVKAYAEENHILLVSHECTAPSLAIAEDNLFRFCPDDTHQAEAVARLMWDEGVRVVIPLWRGDVWGDDLSDATKSSFEKLGGKMVDGVRYSPGAEDFSAELDSLNSKVSQAAVQYGADAVAVYLIAFSEAVPIFIQAAQSNSLLSTVKWYGSDGTAQLKELVNNKQAAQFAVKTSFKNPLYGEGETEKYELIKERIREKIGRDPDVYALTAYDTFWAVAQAYLAAGTDNYDALKKALPQTAESYYGATGWLGLNEAGDRKFGNYDFWSVREDKGAFQWERVARYQVDPSFAGKLTYLASAHVPELRVLIIHSYQEGWEWNQDVQRGVVEGLSRVGFVEGQDYELKTFYMDTKITYTTQEQIERRAAVALDLIDEFKPAIVFVNDDNALRYVAVEYTQRHPEGELPFVFSGINVDPAIYDPIESLEQPGGVITGALERLPYYDAFSFGKRICPDASKIVLLADSSPSSTFVVDAFRERYLDKVTDSPLQVIGPIQMKTFNEWKANVTECQMKADFIGTMTYHQLRAENGEVVPAQEVVDWTVHNSKLPELGFLSFHAEDGFFVAVGVSGYKTGIYVGVIGGEILGGSDPGTIPIVDPKAVDITFNLERAEMLDIKIPAAELVEAAEVFHSTGT